MKDTTLVVAGMATLAAGTYAIRFAGPALRTRITFSPRATKLLEAAAVVLLAALVATTALTQSHGFSGLARPAGVLVGGVLAWRKAPFLAVVLAAAATTALLRLLGVHLTTGALTLQVPFHRQPCRYRSTVSTLAVSAPVTPGLTSALSTRLTRGARAATASTARFTTAMTSSHSPSMVVNMASVRFGSPLSRTTRTASATASPTASPVPIGVTENATSKAPPLSPSSRSHSPNGP
jgi:branched-subunit amino acid transport protein